MLVDDLDRILGLAAGGSFVIAVFAFRSKKQRGERIVALVISILLALLKLNLSLASTYIERLDRPANLKFKHRVFVLAGQSNMAGRGGLSRKSNELRKTWDPTRLEFEFERELTQPDNLVTRLTADMRWVQGMLVFFL